jgi:hypothetical protein
MNNNISGSIDDGEIIERIIFLDSDFLEMSDIDISRKRKKKRSKVYFTEDTEDAIVLYNKETNTVIKNQIYNRRIKYPLEKLAENILNTWSFPYISDSFRNKKTEVVSHILLNLDKYTKEKGKAFSYFSIAAKNYLIINNDSNYKKAKIELSVDESEDSDNYGEQKRKTVEIKDYHTENDINIDNKKHFILLIIRYWDKNIDLVFKKSRDREIANAIVQLMEQYEGIENFNKKNIYVLIREMTGHKVQYITRVINKMKSFYPALLNKYYEQGKI